jgi:hypothetical protein
METIGAAQGCLDSEPIPWTHLKETGLAAKRNLAFTFGEGVKENAVLAAGELQCSAQRDPPSFIGRAEEVRAGAVERAFSKRFNERVGHMPTMFQAGVYSSVAHYLNAAEAAGSDDAKTVIAKMKELPVSSSLG